MKTGILISKVMTKNPVTVVPGTSIQQCAKVMMQKHVGSILVKDGPGVVGILTEQDIVRKSVVKDLSASKTHVDDLMEKNLIVIKETNDAADAIALMKKHNVRHLPVMDSKEQFVGFVTSKDILRMQPDLFKLFAQK